MELTIDRSRWYRGKGDAESRLIRPEDGMMCCLGFLGIACNIPFKALDNIGMPERNPVGTQGLVVPNHPIWDRLIDQSSLSSPIAKAIANVNDAEMREYDREKILRNLFHSIGVSVQFLGER